MWPEIQLGHAWSRWRDLAASVSARDSLLATATLAPRHVHQCTGIACDSFRSATLIWRRQGLLKDLSCGSSEKLRLQSSREMPEVS